MDIDDNDDDFYAPEEPTAPAAPAAPAAQPDGAATTANAATEPESKPDPDEDLEEGEEEDEGGAMDEDDSSDDVSDLSSRTANASTRNVLSRAANASFPLQSMVIITERKDGTSAGPPSSVPLPYVAAGLGALAYRAYQTITIQQYQGHTPALHFQ
jgi:pre-mRNA 3'-end-processing factor FIP1